MIEGFKTSGQYLFGVVHLRPLPGSPGFEGSRDSIREAARRDAGALLDGGLDGFIVENFGDTPFHKDRVPPAVIAEMTSIVGDLVTRAGSDRRVGVNVLRNDALGALAVASATGAAFIRVNVHTGSMYCDQGFIEGRAAWTLRARVSLHAPVSILADVGVKHAVPPAGTVLGESAREAAYRGLADGLIVTGAATGSPADLAHLREVREAVPDRPVWVGSGVEPATVSRILALAHGVIVGTSLKEEGQVGRPVDIDRVRKLVQAAGSPRASRSRPAVDPV